MKTRLKVGDEVTIKYHVDLFEYGYLYGGYCQGGKKGIISSLLTDGQYIVTFDDNNGNSTNYSLTREELIPTLVPKNAFKKIIKTSKLKFGSQVRDVTIVVLVDEYLNVRAGYSVRIPGDKPNSKLADTIATGRANSDKTNLLDMKIDPSMIQSYILYALADGLFRRIKRGSLKIKGVKNISKK